MSFDIRYKNLDALRGVLALCVFIHHYIVTYGWKTNGHWVRPSSEFFNNLGQVSVSLFFMITAFLFTHKVIINKDSIKWGNFYIGRFFRIYPMFLFSSCFVFLLSFYIFDFKINEPISLILSEIKNWLIFSSFGTVNGYAYARYILAGVTWTLLYECFFYLSLPFLKKIFDFKILALPFLCFICFLSVYYRNINFFIYNINSLMFSSFLAGGVVAYIDHVTKIKNRNLLFSFFILLSFWIINNFFNTAYGFVQSIIIGFVFFMFIKGCDFFGFLRISSLKYLGKISYSVYITHGIVLYVFFSILFPTLCNDISFYQYIMLLPVISVLVLLCSAFLSKYIEYPMMRYGKNLINPK